MRLVSYEAGAGPRAGLLRDGRVHDVWGEAFAHVAATTARSTRCFGAACSTRSSRRGRRPPGRGAAPAAAARAPGEDHLHRPELPLAREEQGIEPPEMPTFFAKFANALAAPGATVPLPALEQPGGLRGRGGLRDRHARQGRAGGAGARPRGRATCCSTTSRRATYQFKTPQWMPGKTFDGAAPCGPALVTADEAGPHDAIEIELRLNGEVMQQGSTADLVHSVPALVAYLSSLMTLEPGDVVATGTPSGVGSLRDPKVWLAAGRRDRDLLAAAGRARNPPRLSASAGSAPEGGARAAARCASRSKWSGRSCRLSPCERDLAVPPPRPPGRVSTTGASPPESVDLPWSAWSPRS